MTTALTLETTPHFADYSPTLRSDTTVVAEGCGVRLFGLIPLGGDASLAAAMQKLMSESADKPLAYVTVDVRDSFYLLVTEQCTIVTGHFVNDGVGARGRASRSVDVDADKRGSAGAPSTSREQPAGGTPKDATADRSMNPEEGERQVVTFALDQPGGIGGVRHTLKSWRGRQVEATAKSGSSVRGTFRGLRQGYVVIRTADGGLWTKQMLEVGSIELLE